MEVDVTYKESVEFDYLFNAVVFNYTTLRCKHSFVYSDYITLRFVYKASHMCRCMALTIIVISLSILSTGHVGVRVQMNKLTKEVYRHAFQDILTTAKSDCPDFTVGETLKAIIMDWSDQQLQGLEEAVGRDTAAAVIKGCQVHYTRSVKRVSKRINKGNHLAIKAFNAIAYHIPKASSPEQVTFLFDVLAGEADIAIDICNSTSSLRKYADTHVRGSWQGCKH